MHSILTLKDVCFSYEADVAVLRNINISFHPGETVAVLGGNGAGKTTFFLVCNGILKPQSGTLSHFDAPVSHNKKSLYSLRKSVSIVFQDPQTQLIAPTVESEVSFGPMNLGLPLDTVKQRVEDSLSALNLEPLKTRATHTLSGGEKKQVTIADILAMEPDAVILDEPTASLDPENIQRLHEIIAMLHQKGICVILSTHDMDFAYSVCQRGVVFVKGEILADDDITSIFKNNALLAQAGLRKPLLLDIEERLQQGLPMDRLYGLRNIGDLDG